MKWNLHLPHVHAIHLHPVHWIAQHPVVLALLIAGLVAAAIIGLARMTGTGINIRTLEPSPGSPIMYPYGGAY